MRSDTGIAFPEEDAAITTLTMQRVEGMKEFGPTNAVNMDRDIRIVRRLDRGALSSWCDDAARPSFAGGNRR